MKITKCCKAKVNDNVIALYKCYKCNASNPKLLKISPKKYSYYWSHRELVKENRAKFREEFKAKFGVPYYIYVRELKNFDIIQLQQIAMKVLKEVSQERVELHAL